MSAMIISINSERFGIKEQRATRYKGGPKIRQVRISRSLDYLEGNLRRQGIRRSLGWQRSVISCGRNSLPSVKLSVIGEVGKEPGDMQLSSWIPLDLPRKSYGREDVATLSASRTRSTTTSLPSTVTVQEHLGPRRTFITPPEVIKFLWHLTTRSKLWKKL